MLWPRFGCDACKLPFCVCLDLEARLGSDDEKEEVDMGPEDVKVDVLLDDEESCFCFSVPIKLPPGVVLSSKRGDEGGGDQLRASDKAIFSPDETLSC